MRDMEHSEGKYILTRAALGHLLDWILIGLGLYVLKVISWGSTLSIVISLSYGVILLVCIYLLVRSLVRDLRK